MYNAYRRRKLYGNCYLWVCFRQTAYYGSVDKKSVFFIARVNYLT